MALTVASVRALVFRYLNRVNQIRQLQQPTGHGQSHSFRMLAALLKAVAKRTQSLRPLQVVSALLLLAMATLAAQAQSAQFSGAVSTLGSGFNAPIGVAVDKAGNVYVGDFSNNAVKEIVAGTGGAAAGTVNSNSTVNTLGSGFSKPEGVAVDRAGNVYVANYGTSEVMEIVAGTGNAASGTVNSGSTVIALGSGFNLPTGVAVDGAGNVYVADYNNHAVKEIVAGTGGAGAGTVNSGSTVIALGSGFSYPEGVAVDGAGNVYVADNGDNEVKEIVAGTGSAGVGKVNSSSTVNILGSGFRYPEGVAVDGAGNVYVADSTHYVVKEIVAGTGTATAGTVNSTSTVNTLGGGFDFPEGVAVDGAGNVYVADTGNNAVKEIVPSASNFGSVAIGVSTPPTLTLNFTFDANVTIIGGVVLTQGAKNQDFTNAGTGTCTGGNAYIAGESCSVVVQFSPLRPGPRLGAVDLLSGAGVLLATAHVNGVGSGPAVVFPTNTSTTVLGSGFSAPSAVALDGAGNVYVPDLNNGTLSEIVNSSSTVTTLVSGIAGAIGAAVDGAGNVYFSENTNNLVKEIVAGTGGAAAGTVNSSSTVNTVGNGFHAPTGLAVDGAGNVYVADDKNNAVKEIMAGTGGAAVGTVNSSSTVNTLGSGFSDPYGVAVDGAGNVFVADAGHNLIKEIMAGTGGAAAGTVNSSSTVNTLYGGFAFPQGVALDGADNVYVSDNGNGAVKEIMAGTGTAAAGTVNSSSTMILLGTSYVAPISVAVDGVGNIYATDTGNHEVKKINVASPPSLTFPSTDVGVTSTAQTVIVQNIGNSALTFPIPTTGANPSVAANFELSNSTTCPTLTVSSGSNGTLAGGTSCNLLIEFAPTTTGMINGSVVLSDTNLNVNPSTTQSVSLSGTGIVSVTQLVFTSTPASTLTAGGNAGSTITVSEENASAAVVASATDIITLTVTGPGGYSKTYTATAVSGVAIFNLSGTALTAAGAYTYTPSISGNTSVTAGTANETVASATAANVSATQGASQNAIIGASFQTALQVQVTDAYSNPVGGVVVTFTPPATGPSAVLSASTCTTSTTATIGSCSVTATANGTASTAAYTVIAKPAGVTTGASFSLNNLKYTPTVSLAEASSTLVYGQAESLTATFTPASVVGTAPSTGITFYDNASLLNAAPVNSGSATLSNLHPSVGTHTYTASYAGDSNFNASSVATATPNVVVNKASATVTAQTQSLSLNDGQSGVIPVVVTGQYSGAGIAVPSATVSYTILNSASASVATGSVTLASGAASVPITSTLAPGPYTVNVTYGGDGNYAAATNPAVVNLVVSQIQPTINWAQPAAIPYGATLAGALNATAMNGTTVVPGTMTYTATATVGGASPVTGGIILPAGAYTLAATFTPTDTSMYKSATATVPLVVNKATAGISLTTSANTVLVQNPVTFTATVSSVVSPPTGTVTFFDGTSTTTPIGTATLTGSVATLTTSSLAIGTHTITAVYSGDTNFVTASSPALLQTVQDFNLSISTSSGSSTTATVVPGGTANYTLIISPTGSATFPANVALSVSGLPAGATYTLTPSSIAAGSGTTNVILAIQVPATTAMLHPSQPLGKTVLPIALGLLLLPFSRRMRKSAKRLGRTTSFLLLLLAGTGAVAGLTGCGVNTGYFGQLQHSYSVSVTGTSGALVHSTTVTLNVQ